MKIMCVDLGLARTGVAISDITESFAFPDSVITERNPQRLIERLCLKAKELSAELIVVGLPRNMDGSEGFRAEECRASAKDLEAACKIPVVLWDERCTTLSAHTVLNMNDTKGKKRKETVDAVAAVMILEDYLTFRKNQR